LKKKGEEECLEDEAQENGGEENGSEEGEEAEGCAEVLCGEDAAKALVTYWKDSVTFYKGMTGKNLGRELRQAGLAVNRLKKAKYTDMADTLEKHLQRYNESKTFTGEWIDEQVKERKYAAIKNMRDRLEGWSAEFPPLVVIALSKCEVQKTEDEAKDEVQWPDSSFVRMRPYCFDDETPPPFKPSDP
jgi:hypothetical protein